MKICFTSDLHGRQVLYEQLDRLVAAERPGLLILGGDMFTDGDVDDPVGTQVAFIERIFIPRVNAWRAAVPGMAVACILGNHDWLCSQAALENHHRAGRIVLLNGAAPWQCNGTSYVGFHNTPPTPYWVKDFERLDLAGDEIPETGGAVWDPATGRAHQAEPLQHFAGHPCLAQELTEVVRIDRPWVFVCHAPPHGTNLDRLPHIESPVGSRAVRQFIEQRGPMLSLHGHIHESPEVTGGFSDRVGGTLCVNPGQTTERLHAILFDSRDPAATLRHTAFP